jgi:hypothetical protein
MRFVEPAWRVGDGFAFGVLAESEGRGSMSTFGQQFVITTIVILGVAAVSGIFFAVFWFGLKKLRIVESQDRGHEHRS